MTLHVKNLKVCDFDVKFDVNDDAMNDKPGALPGEGLPVFLCNRELKKFASTPSPLAAAPTLAPSI